MHVNVGSAISLSGIAIRARVDMMTESWFNFLKCLKLINLSLGSEYIYLKESYLKALDDLG